MLGRELAGQTLLTQEDPGTGLWVAMPRPQDGQRRPGDYR